MIRQCSRTDGICRLNQNLEFQQPGKGEITLIWDITDAGDFMHIDHNPSQQGDSKSEGWNTNFKIGFERN